MTLPRLLLVFASFIFLCSNALGREGNIPVAAPARVDEGPVVDGILNDKVWEKAAPIGSLTEVEPVEGAVPSEKTEVRLLYTPNTFYIAISCFDRNPEAIVATQMERDARLDPDDRVEILIDTYHDRRNAFWFQINPAGSKGDALINNNAQDFNKPWDGIWEGKARITREGWEAELALPFKTLNFDPDGTTWGFNIRRFIRRKNEVCRWATPSQDIFFFSVADAGILTGLEGREQGIGLDIVPFVASNYMKDREVKDRDFDLEPGFDAFYNITPSLTLSVTANTDFAETEVDERRVNLSRFPLFFPEKRDFFLRDAGIFKFSYLHRTIIPFFSRRIGLDQDGEEVPLVGGAKLTGRAGDYNIGILDIQTENKRNLPSKNLFVSRISRNIWEQSNVGFIVTRGNPAESGMNEAFGMDFNYRTSNFLGNKTLAANAFFLSTHTSGEGGDGTAFGFRGQYPSDLFSLTASMEAIGREFNPALGFVPRRGIRQYGASAAYKPRLYSWIRQLFFELAPAIITDTGNETETWSIFMAPVNVELESGDEFEINVTPQFDRLDEPFEIQEGLFIPEGSYRFTRYRVKVETAEKRPVTFRGTYQWGTFFNGKRRDINLSGEFKLSAHFFLGLDYQQNEVDLRQGDFTTRVGRLRANIQFTPEISWNNYIQFDNESDQIGLNSRFRWILSPGKDLYVVFNQGWQRYQDDTIAPLLSEFSFKIQYTLRF